MNSAPSPGAGAAKTGLRARLRALRDALPQAEVEERSLRILGHAARLPEFQAARLVSCYAAFRGEVRTRPLLERALAEGKRVAVPRLVPGTWEMELVEIHGLNDLAPNARGIPEPPPGAGVVIGPEEAEVHFVPGLAFDRAGGRLGYGRGCYDRLLSKVEARAFGLAYDIQVVDDLPAETHDVPLTGVVTERGVLRKT